MSSGGLRGMFLHNLPSSVITDFCRSMDALSDPDWTRFASEVLRNMTDVRLADRRERRTDWVFHRLESRNEQVGYLVDVLEHLQLLRQRDIILSLMSSLNPSQTQPPPPPPRPPPPPSSQDTLPLVLPLPKSKQPEGGKGVGGGSALPPPAPPPPDLQSFIHQQAQPAAAVMHWKYEEVHAGTEGFSSSRQVGEGGFGVVYRASLRNTECAIKRLREDGPLDWNLLQESFQTEVEKLSTFRHPNIVDLLGFSVGGGSMCLIYSYMHNRSLEDQLHDEGAPGLSWSQRVSIVTEASAALQFLHCPPGEQESLIHGDVKSSNILLDRHMVAKLSDFGLARFRPRSPSGRLTTQTASVGRTETVRGTLAYLPDEYVRNGELGTALDVFSFGVVLLEVLTGRRAVKKDQACRDRYLKDLVEELEETGSASSQDAWMKQLDERLMAGGAAEPTGCLQVAALAVNSLKKKWKKRPKMITVFENLEDINRRVKGSCSSSWSRPPEGPPRPPGPPSSLESSMGAVVHQLSRLGPLEDTFPSHLSSSSSSSSSCSSSSLGSLASPHPLHSASSLPPSSSSSSSSSSTSSSSSSSSSFLGPCETDESRGFSQYIRSNGASSLSPRPPRTPHHRPLSGPIQNRDWFPAQPRPLREAPPGPDLSGLHAESPERSLQSTSGLSVVISPAKQRLLEKTSQYQEGRIGTPELLSTQDLYGGGPSEDFRGPEESDDLDFLPSKHH